MASAILVDKARQMKCDIDAITVGYFNYVIGPIKNHDWLVRFLSLVTSLLLHLVNENNGFTRSININV